MTNEDIIKSGLIAMLAVGDKIRVENGENSVGTIIDIIDNNILVEVIFYYGGFAHKNKIRFRLKDEIYYKDGELFIYL